MNAIRPKSLDSLMDDMASRLETIKPAVLREVSRIEVLIAVDPLLASLHKEFCDVKGRHNKLLETNGPDDAMVEVSADVVDSAQSALDTRILELEEEAAGEGDEAIALRRHIRREKARAELELSQKIHKEKKEREKENDAFFWMMVWTWITQQTLAAARNTLSASAAFSTVNPMLGKAWRVAQAA